MAALTYADLAFQPEDWKVPKYRVLVVEHLLREDGTTLEANGYACTVLATTARDAITAWQRLYPELTPELWATLQFSDGIHTESADHESWDRINVRMDTTLTVAFVRPPLPLTVDLWSENGKLLSTTTFALDPHHLANLAWLCCDEIPTERYIRVNLMTFELPSGQRFGLGIEENNFIRAISGLTTRMRLNVVGPIAYV
jgi:hypothetical protein